MIAAKSSKLKQCRVQIGEKQLELEWEGQDSFGDDIFLLDLGDDLTFGSLWHEKGYTVEHFLSESDWLGLSGAIHHFVKGLLHDRFSFPLKGFALESYHEFVDDTVHLAFIEHTRKCFSLNTLDFPFHKITKRISEICNVPLQLFNPAYGKETNEFCIRIVRPDAKKDYNPPHRDVYLPTLKNCINIYVPLSGSNSLSSLPLLPGSHLLNESQIKRSALHAKVNGLEYTVPIITDTSVGLKMIRPNPGYNNVLVFSPYLIHGCGVNFNKDKTRISLEMRFWRKEQL